MAPEVAAMAVAVGVAEVPEKAMEGLVANGDWVVDVGMALAVEAMAVEVEGVEVQEKAVKPKNHTS